MCIGQSIEKIDGIAITTGEPVYTDDYQVDGELYVHIVRSPHAFAKILSIDSSKLKGLHGIPGIELILTWEDVPNVRFTVAGQSYPEPSPYDRKILDQIVRYVGDPVAIIAAIDKETAIDGERKLKIEYEIMNPVLDPREALTHKSIIHPEDDLFTHFDFGTDQKTNVAGTYATGFGDIDDAYDTSFIKLERTYSSQAQAHAMMETYRSRAYLDDDSRLTLVTSTQIPFHVRRIAAQALEMKEENVRVLKPRIGGGFGGKQSIATELFAGIVTLRTGKPCKVVYNRKESFSTSSSRHMMEFKVRLGATADGIIQAIDLDALSDTGAYGEHCWTVLMVAGHKSLPLYNRAKASRYRGTAVYTNKMPAGALRGYGVTQAIFALESAINELALELKMDPVELRLKNIIREGETHPMLEGTKPEESVSLDSCTLAKCIEMGRDLIGWEEKYPVKHIDRYTSRGVGMAITMQGSGIAEIDSASAEITYNSDTDYILNIGATDMGTGCDTILMQMAADGLGVDPKHIRVHTGDTDTMAFDTGSYASSTTYVTGNAVYRAVSDLKLKIERGDKLPITGKGCFMGTSSPPPFIAGFAEVEVDHGTGRIDMKNYVATVDCGTVINHNLAKIQVEGGLVQGIGMALYEDVQYTDRGKMMSDSFMQYKVPTRRDTGNLEVVFVPSFEPTGPKGAKSIGEVVINTPPPAIAHAVANATGVFIRDLPITPEKILLGRIANKPEYRHSILPLFDFVKG